MLLQGQGVALSLWCASETAGPYSIRINYPVNRSPMEECGGIMEEFILPEEEHTVKELAK